MKPESINFVQLKETANPKICHSKYTSLHNVRALHACN